MKRRLPVVLLSAVLLALPATAASAGGHGPGGSWGSSGPGKHAPAPTGGKHRPGPGATTAPATPAPSPSALCGGARTHAVIPWDAYTCDKATGYFLYRKLDRNKAAGFHNSAPQTRVALHDVWAWPTADERARKGASPQLPRNAQVVPLELTGAALADVCRDPKAYGLQVDLVGDGVAGRGLDVRGNVPETIRPPEDTGFPQEHYLAFYGHYELTTLLAGTTLCAPPSSPAPTPPPVTVPSPEPSMAPEPSPEPSPEPTPRDDVAVEPTPTPSPDVTPAPSPSPSERSEVLPAPADEPSPTASTSPAPSPSPSERAEVLSASDDDVLAATGAGVVAGLIAAFAALAGGAALLVLRRRGRTTP